MPKRIQRKRTKGWRMPDGAIYVGRPSIYGNPWSLTDYGEYSINLFRRWLTGQMRLTGELRRSRERLLEGLDALRGKDLACWCPEGSPCHADILLEIANA